MIIDEAVVVSPIQLIPSPDHGHRQCQIAHKYIAWPLKLKLMGGINTSTISIRLSASMDLHICNFLKRFRAYILEEFGLAAQWLEMVVQMEPAYVPLSEAYSMLAHAYNKVRAQYTYIVDVH